MVHNESMKKIALALASLLLLASCGDNPGNGEEEGKSYISALQHAAEASLKQNSCYLSTPGAGGKIAVGVKDLDGTYYHIKGDSLSFDLGLTGLKAEELSSCKGLLELKGGSLAIDTNFENIPSSLKNYLTVSPLKAKSYFDGDALYLNASGEKNETNATLGLMLQTLIQTIPGNEGYVLYGGGSRLDTKSKYKGKWSLTQEEKDQAKEHLPLIKEDGNSSDLFSGLSSFLQGAYEDEKGQTAFSFETKEDGQKKISFRSTDKDVLSGAFASAISKGDFSLITSEGISAPTYSEAKEKADKFLSYAEPKTFAVETYFQGESLLQTRLDINFSLDSAKINELYPSGMIEIPAQEAGGEAKHLSLDGSLAFSANLLTSFSSAPSFSLPEELSSYKEFPEIIYENQGE